MKKEYLLRIVLIIILFGIIYYFNLIPKVITVTFKIDGDISNQNTNDNKLFFSYTDKDGNTIKSKEGTEIKLTCLSYFNRGCKLNKLPTIDIKGHIVYGFSTTLDGENVDILNSTFYKSITLYAKIDTKKIDIEYQKNYGNIILEIENGIKEDDIKDILETLDTIYEYYPEIFYFNGKIFWLMSNTYNELLESHNSHIELTSGCTIFSNSYNNASFRYNSNNREGFRTLMHEVAHSFDRSFQNHISQRDDFINLYNKYKELANRPFYTYSYNSPQEFFADAFSSSISKLINEKTGKNLYYKYSRIPDEIKEYVVSVLAEKKEYLKSINLIR